MMRSKTRMRVTIIKSSNTELEKTKVTTMMMAQWGKMPTRTHKLARLKMKGRSVLIASMVSMKKKSSKRRLFCTIIPW